MFERSPNSTTTRKPLAYYMRRIYNNTITATASQGQMAPLVWLSLFFRRKVDLRLLSTSLLKC